ncbi:MAG: hypothetical protein ACI81L_003424, partial [Verrucomicrobiales bacterium]
MRQKMQMLIGMASGFLLVLMIGVASADETPTSNPTLSDVELAPAVVVAAGADFVDLNAVSRLNISVDGIAQRGTAFQLDDGRIASVAHALIDARRAAIGEDGLVALDLETVSISRLHDLAAFAAEELPAGLSAATSLGEIGQVVALAGV